MPSSATSQPAAASCARSGLSASRTGLVLLMWMKMRRAHRDVARRRRCVPPGPASLMWPMRAPVFGPAPARIISSSVNSVPSNNTQVGAGEARAQRGRHGRAAGDEEQRAAAGRDARGRSSRHHRRGRDRPPASCEQRHLAGHREGLERQAERRARRIRQRDRPSERHRAARHEARVEHVEDRVGVQRRERLRRRHRARRPGVRAGCSRPAMVSTSAPVSTTAAIGEWRMRAGRGPRVQGGRGGDLRAQVGRGVQHQPARAIGADGERGLGARGAAGSPARARRQPGPAEFHCGNPPPAARQDDGAEQG